MKVSIQGIKGSFHHEAVAMYFSTETKIVANSSFTELVNSVVNSESDCGIIAIENTISGTIHNNINLIRNSGLFIQGEIYLRIEQNMAALTGSSIEDITQVESHYMAINQCRTFFKSYPHIKLIESEDTASSIKKIADRNLSHTAAIGSRLAIEEYGLQTLFKGIETNKKNYTRFLVIAKEFNNDPLINKASIAMDLSHQKGSLAKVLGLIYEKDINLSKIESFPIVGEPWHYQFFLDLNFSDYRNYQKVLHDLKPHTNQVQVLGEYQFGIESYTKINTIE